MFKTINFKSKTMKTETWGFELFFFKFLIRYSEFAGYLITLTFYVWQLKCGFSFGFESKAKVMSNTKGMEGTMYDA